MHEGTADSEVESCDNVLVFPDEKKRRISSNSLIEEIHCNEDDDYDDLESMKEELESLEAETVKLRKSREKDEIRRKLVKKRAEVKKLKGKKKILLIYNNL